MSFRLEKSTLRWADARLVKKLYLSAFPAEERAPFAMVKRPVKTGDADMYLLKDDGEFVGFANVAHFKDLEYLFYFAIDESKRGCGYGSKTLKVLQRIYKDKRFFLAREQLDESEDNYEQRIKRFEFYSKNGLIDMPYTIREGKVVYDVMGTGGSIEPVEYMHLMEAWRGRPVGTLCEMKRK